MKPLILVSAIGMAFIKDVASAAPATVELVQTEQGGWELRRHGKPFFVKGAGGYKRLPELKAAGANSVRVWNSEEHSWFSSTTFLDDAHQVGLTVMLGLELPGARHFDYTDITAVDGLIERMRKVVRKRKDHPALLFWGVGNEVEWGGNNPEASTAVWPALNRIAEMVKQEDPVHPTVIVLAGQDLWKIQAVQNHCPAIDVLGLNTYENLAQLPAQIQAARWTKPYLVTEYGCPGWWAAKRTPWRTVFERTSAEKAAQFALGYEAGIRGQPACLGSYAFIWGHKEEATFTYFGTHLDTGEALAPADTLQQLWTGKPPATPAPKLDGILSPAAGARILPDTAQTAHAQVQSPKGLRFTWVLATDRSYATYSGDISENQPAAVVKEWTTDAPRLDWTAPTLPDTYRLYLYVRDKNGKAATANFPFAVEATP